MWSNERRRRMIRKMAEQVMGRSEYLDPADRDLLDQVFDKGVLPAELARVAGLHERSIQRRVHTLLYRLSDPAVEYVLRHHAEWHDDIAEVALAIHVRGKSMRDASEQLGLSLHRVRQCAAVVDATIDQGMHGGRKRKTATRLMQTLGV